MLNESKSNSVLDYERRAVQLSFSFNMFVTQAAILDEGSWGWGGVGGGG